MHAAENQMSLPVRQQRVLNDIEASLQAADHQLTSMFATFTRLTSGDDLPATEAIRPRLPQAMLACVMAMAVVSVILIGALLGGPSCGRVSGRAVTRNTFAPVTAIKCKAGTPAPTAGR
jgi:hypothetical protein